MTMLRIVTIALVAASIPVAAAADWTPFAEDADAVCADGSAVHYLERAADPTSVVLYFEGGGGCWSADTCAFDRPDPVYYSRSEATQEWLDQRGGIFDFADPRNPLADFSFVYVPYCTGDLHLGDNTMAYADDVVVQHHGYPNAMVALDHLAQTYPEATEVVVAGISAGSVPTPLYAAHVQDDFPDARVVVIGDSSSAYPDVAALNAYIGTLWGSLASLPDWPETQGITVREWSVPGLFGVAAAHAPNVTFGTVDHAYDQAQVENATRAGIDADDLLALIEENHARVAADGAEVAHYIAPGSAHTILDTDGLYELEVEGVPLIDWLTELIESGPPADVHCRDCH